MIYPNSPDRMRYRGQFRPEFSRLHFDKDLLWVIPFDVRYVIGISGERFSGKSAALNYLTEKKGFRVYNLANELRKIASQFGLPLEPRSVLQDLGDELRAKNNDAAYLARLTLRRIHRDHQPSSPSHSSASRRVAVTGFKRPEELEVFEKLGRFRQLNICSERKFRFTRALESGSLEVEIEHLRPPPDPDEEAFSKYIDQRDLHGDDNPWTEGFGQNVAGVTARVAERPNGAKDLHNEKKLTDLYEEMDREIELLDKKFRTAN